MTVGLSGTVLPLHPQPKPGEIFSSWFCRIAQANGIKLHTLEVQLWGRGKEIWTRDIDRSIDDNTLALVATSAGTSFERARETTLKSYEGLLFETLTTKTQTDWVLPSGVYHRIRKRPCMQFCPLCLATDEIPYFRKKWRLAFSTFCDEHDVMLHDCCPECKSPVMIHRQEMGDRNSWRIDSLTICTVCGFDLKRAAAYQAPIVDIDVWNTLKVQACFMDLGWTFAGTETFSYSHLYFDVLRNLILKLKWKKSPGRLLSYAVEHLRVIGPPPTRTRDPFENLDLRERHYLLQIATWYMLDWPSRFLTACREMKIRYSELTHEFCTAPFWFLSEARQLEFKPLGPSHEEREAMRGLLRKTEEPIKRQQLKKFISARMAKMRLRMNENR